MILHSVNYPSSINIVGSDFRSHLISGKYFNIVLSHFPRKITENHFFGVKKLNSEKGVGQILNNFAFHHKNVIFHKDIIVPQNYVKINVFLPVIATVCSKHAERLPSAVTIDQLSPFSFAICSVPIE